MDREYLLARAEDASCRAYKTNVPSFLGFLSEEEVAIVSAHLKKQNIKHVFWGGFSEATRRYLCCLPDWCEEPDFPITAVSFTFKECYPLSHRDFLGCLMSLGITRECVGDILIEKGRAVAFLSADIAGFAMSQISKVGNVGVDIKEGFVVPLPGFGEKAEFCETVASLRLDNVVAALCGASRNEAAKLIEDKKVSLSGVLQEKLSKTVSSGDKISIRGKGFFEIADCSSLSKKGRIILKYQKYV